MPQFRILPHQTLELKARACLIATHLCCGLLVGLMSEPGFKLASQTTDLSSRPLAKPSSRC